MFAGFHDRMFVDNDALSARYRTLFDLDRLHVRAVHDMWGIADGLVVALVDSDSALEVSEGVGYDNQGTPLELTATARLEPHAVGEYDIVLTECGVVARASSAMGHCEGSLVLASASVKVVEYESLIWADLHLRGRLAGRRRSVFVGAGSFDVAKVEEPTVVVPTLVARFRSIPLYFCDVVDLDIKKKPPVSGLWSVAALNRHQGSGDRHGPFFTICTAKVDSFTLLFTRSIAKKHPSLRVIWVGVVPSRPVVDVEDSCQTYPIPDPEIN